MRVKIGLLLAVGVLAAFAMTARAEDKPQKEQPQAALEFERKPDVIYRRKFGTALTMDVFTPKNNPNGLGVIFVMSGGWFSSHDSLGMLSTHPIFNVSDLLKRGYTVFAVVHGSQPKFTIPEILEDMHRATRFIRHHAKDYKIDPERIGITGLSAGGHLSLMQGTAGNAGDAKTKDPIDGTSSRVQAVACFFPPTDFLNYGKKGEVMLGTGTLKDFKAPFDFREMDKITNAFVPVVLEEKRREIGKKISPAYHVTKDSPPTLIIHGDKDLLVPIQQAEIMIAKFKEAGVPCELVVRKGEQHGWKNLLQDMKLVADWFDKYLLKKETTGAASAAK